jgi:hypothetical protein
MPKIIDLTGQRFGKLFVTGYAGRGYKRSSLWHVRCDCGTEKTASSTYLRHHNLMSCGCGIGAPTHGASRRGGKMTSEYRIWQNMKGRCSNSNMGHFRHYGGRGIKVCDRWMDFQNFIDDMGQRPSLGHSLDRMDNDGDYEPGNCRWATATEQGANTRTNRYVTVKGETMVLAEAFRRFSVAPKGTVSARISRGWDVERALLTPSG